MCKHLWALLLLGSAHVFAQTYPSAPFFTNIGQLKCGIRLYSAGQVQTWCYTLPNPLKLVHNTISTIATGNVITLGFVQGPDQVLWVVSQLGTGTAIPIKYQINNSGDHDAYQEGILGSISIPNRPVLAAKTCVYLCCAMPDPATALFSRS